jgi:hypothetical protein
MDDVYHTFIELILTHREFIEEKGQMINTKNSKRKNKSSRAKASRTKSKSDGIHSVSRESMYDDDELTESDYEEIHFEDDEDDDFLDEFLQDE